MWPIALVAVAFSASAAGGGVFSSNEPEFLDARDVFRIEAIDASDDVVHVRAAVAPGYYVYRHRLTVEAGGSALPLQLPRGKPKTDEFFGTTEVYRDGLGFDVRSAGATTATLHWQGCADAGICYPPQTVQIELPPTPRAVNGWTRSAGPTSTAPEKQSSTAPAVRPASAAVGDAPAPATAASERPMKAPRALVATAAAADAAESARRNAADVARSTPAALGEDEALARRLAGSGILAAVAVFFGLGLLLAFTPCTLPMVPIVSGLVLGGQPSPRRALALSAAYVVPMALTYAGLGVAAGMSGANLQAALQNPWMLGAFAVLFVVLSMPMFGLFELQLPAWLRERLDRAGRGTRGGTVTGAAAMGVLSALLVGPCMTAPLAGALLYIGQTGDPLVGGVALFALGLGMGLPLLAIATFGARVLPKPGAWMNRVKAAFGFVLLALAVSMLGRVVSPSMTLALWGAWLLALAVGLMALAAHRDAASPWRWSTRGAAAIVAVWAVAMMVGGAGGSSSPWRPLAALAGPAAGTVSPVGSPVAFVPAKSRADVARRLTEAGARGQWTLVDFYADWCVSCHVIEREVFGDPRVAAALGHLQVLRPDVTANDATDQALMRAWGVAGPPTLLLIGPDGRERREQRVVGEIDAAQFLGQLERAGARVAP
ncbi:protein-disulfide reductase DsbD [Stenotrophomonas acidaminiphila]|nr:protein-disulfide reductase DsbD [Stenotrophomonas acidaminiphila]